MKGHNMVVFHPLAHMVLAGAALGAWPLVMNRSGLTGMQSTVWFAVIVALLLVVLVATTQGIRFDQNARWGVVLFACCLGGLGLLLLNIGLANTTPQQVSKLFLIMVMAQIAVPSIYHAIINGDMDLRTKVGLAFAAAAAWLLK